MTSFVASTIPHQSSISSVASSGDGVVKLEFEVSEFFMLGECVSEDFSFRRQHRVVHVAGRTLERPVHDFSPNSAKHHGDCQTFIAMPMHLAKVGVVERERLIKSAVLFGYWRRETKCCFSPRKDNSIFVVGRENNVKTKPPDFYPFPIYSLRIFFKYIS